MGITEERIKRITEQAAAMKAIGRASIDVSGDLEALASDNAAMESEIQGLEEADARLRERLNRSENHDAYMELPVDADGVPIRIGDVVYGNPGIAWTVVCLRMSKLGCKVEMENMPFLRNPDELSHKKPDPLEPEPADSWEKLEEDAKKDACELAGKGGSDDCVGCKWFPRSNCNEMARLEILKRAKKLAGVEDTKEASDD